MFITEELSPAETLSELLSLKGLEKADTVRFRELRHDRDLCPGFRERVSALLDAYKSHRTDVHDVQGPRDEGIDVQLDYERDGRHRLGMQVKSFREIDDWAKGKDRSFVQRLKAQYATAVENAKVQDYYLLLCTDEIAHRGQIRTICSEMKAFGRLRIVLPRQALAFYEASHDEIAAYVSRLLCRHDSVLEAAVDALADLPSDRAYVLLALVCLGLSGRRDVTSEELQAVFQDWREVNPRRDPAEDRLAEIVGELEGGGLGLSSDVVGFAIEVGQLPPALCAIYFDQRQRHGGEPLAAMAALLGLEGFGLGAGEARANGQGRRTAPRRKARRRDR